MTERIYLAGAEDIRRSAHVIDAAADRIARACGNLAAKLGAESDALRACRATLEWARTPGRHGGNPYGHAHVQAAERAVAAADGRAPEDWAPAKRRGVCVYCRERVTDESEAVGSPPGAPPAWATADGDYGCDASPDTGPDGAGAHRTLGDYGGAE